MCGIAGIVNFDDTPVSEEELVRMASEISHRGPDGHGFWRNGPAGLAHRRLSIIDLQGGAQPMANEDGSILTSFNGEIYNFREIRKELEAKGHIFKTSSDTEVIVHLYEDSGPKCVEKLNGMFAFAVYDSKKKHLLLARDRLGQKPLVYFATSAKFAFASELAALAQIPEMPREINFQALHDYFSLQFIPHPETIYEGVNKLPPGHILELDLTRKTISISRYWHCDFRQKSDMAFADAADQLKYLLQDSVRLRMVSDVPLGAFLSGGLDSSLVAGLMSKVSTSKVKTFTIGFDENAYDERRYAEIAAARFTTDHHVKIVQPADFGALEKLVRHCGEPFADSSILPTYLLSRFTRESVTVALSGDGADELFSGYYRYMMMKFAKFADFVPAAVRRPLVTALACALPSCAHERTSSGKLRRILKSIAAEPQGRYLEIISRFDENLKSSVYGERFEGFVPRETDKWMKKLYDAAGASDPVEKIIEGDVNSYLPCDILVKTDIASMACSLELRSPFLDYRIAEFAASLPLEFKLSGRTRKLILGGAFKDIVPEEILQREKLGFGVPVANWFRNEWKETLKERLLTGSAVRDGYLNRQTLEKMIDKHCSGASDLSYPLFSLLIFELWMDDHF